MNILKLIKNELSNYKTPSNIFLSLQYALACFSGVIIIPLILGISVGVGLFASGIATLIYSIITKGKIGIFLGSSASYVSMFLIIKSNMSINYAVGSYIGSAVVFILLSLICKKVGYKVIKKIFSDTVTGSVIICIGISLVPVSLSMMSSNYRLALISIIIMVILNELPIKVIKRFSVLLTILIMYIYSILIGLVDFNIISNAKWFALPPFITPKYDINAIILMACITFIGVSEHIGQVRINGLLLNNDHFENPGLHRSFLGDGIALLLAGLGMTQGVTTYGESNSLTSLTGNKNNALIRGATVIAILLSVLGKFCAVLQSIPTPIVGGISLLLFATIVSAGLNIIKNSDEDIMDFKNTLIIILPIFLTVMVFIPNNPFILVINSNLTLEGLSLATLIAIGFNIIFIVLNKFLKCKE